MAGTINLALTQQFDMDGAPLSGGLLYFFTAGTTTPQTPFQDIALTIPHPNPIILDASGRVPMFYLADGFIKIRLTDKNGVVVIAADQLLVIGPSSGGGGSGGGVDVTTVLATGDIKARYGTGALDGFVRCNANTIGQTGSSATELAGPKAQALYEYLWAFSNITLDSATKGASAVADFGALKRLILPDLRGRTIAGMDDMGATAVSRLTSTYFGASAIVLGNAGGAESRALAIANMVAHAHGGTTDTKQVPHTHAVTGSSDSQLTTHNHGLSNVGSALVTPNAGGISVAAAGSGLTGTADLSHVHAVSGSALTPSPATATDHTHTFSTDTGTGMTATAFATATPSMVMTIYIKL